MTKPLTIKKLMIPPEAFEQLSPKQRSAVLFLGRCLNDAACLRNLLLQATFSFGRFEEEVRKHAGMHLVLLLGGLLIGKMVEGREVFVRWKPAEIYGMQSLPDEVLKVGESLKSKLNCDRIKLVRNKFSFHYDKDLHENDPNSNSGVESIVISENNLLKSIFIFLSNEAIGQQIYDLYGKSDLLESLASFHGDAFAISTLYIGYCYQAIRYIMRNNINMENLPEEMISFEAPPVDGIPLHFFMSAPENQKLPEKVS